MKHDYITHSDTETQKLGEEFAGSVKPGDIICLFGNLGAGKTTFSKGFATGLGITSRIISPTFTLVREHEVQNPRIKKLYHIDLYRLENLSEIESIGLSEIFEDKQAVVLIEWAEKLGDNLPKNRYEIRFKQSDNDSRAITIEQN